MFRYQKVIDTDKGLILQINVYVWRYDILKCTTGTEVFAEHYINKSSLFIAVDVSSDDDGFMFDR